MHARPALGQGEAAATMTPVREKPHIRLIREALEQRTIGRLPAARALLDRAVTAAARAGDPIGEAVARRRRAAVLRDLGEKNVGAALADLNTADRLLGPGATLDERLSLDLARARLVGERDPWGALAIYEGALTRAEAAGKWGHAANAALGMAVAAQIAGDLDLALAHCRRAVATADRGSAAPPKQLARVYLVTALVLVGAYEEALGLAEKLEPELVKQPVPRRQVALAVALAWLARNDAPKALAALDGVMAELGRGGPKDLADELFFARAKALLLRGEWAQAIEAVKKGQGFVRLEDSRLEGEALLGRALLQGERGAEAVQVLERWAAGMEALRARGRQAGVTLVRWYFSSRLAAMQNLIELQVQTGRLEQALATSQQLKARWFTEMVAAARASGRGLLDPAVAARRKLLESIEESATPAPIGLREIQARLPPRTALLDYVFTQDALIVTAITREAAVLRRLRLARAGVETHVRRFVGELAAGSAGAPDDGAVLAAVLREPLAALGAAGAAVRQVVVIPSGPLYDVPWSALEGAAVVERYDVVRAPSIATYFALGERSAAVRAAVQPVLGVGDAREDLPDALGAVASLGPLYGAAAVLTGRQASETEVKRLLPAVSVAEFAVHAYPTADGGGAWLALAPGEGDDGALHASEIAEVSMPGCVVLLFACGSGVGRPSLSDEAATLDRAFALAGASAVVTSLWPVDDAAAAAFSASFHAAYAEGANVVEAFGRAQRMLSRSDDTASGARVRGMNPVAGPGALSNPRAWAGYVLTAGPAW